MGTIASMKSQGTWQTLDGAMDILFAELDKAIDDLENGRVLSEEELWAEIDAM